MSFLPAVKKEITDRSPNDPVRVTLEYMVKNAVGRHNSIPLKTLVRVLKQKGVNTSETYFQQSVLAASRGGDYFIGSWGHGFFLIDTIEDAKEMQSFYDIRIAAEIQNLTNLKRQAAAVGWVL
jgi:hypothetical protein